MRLVDEVGSFTDTSSPAALWRDERRIDLFRAAESDLAERRRRAQEELREAARWSRRRRRSTTRWSTPCAPPAATAWTPPTGKSAGWTQRLDDVERSRQAAGPGAGTVGATVVDRRRTSPHWSRRRTVALADADARKAAQNRVRRGETEKKDAERELAGLRDGAPRGRGPPGQHPDGPARGPGGAGRGRRAPP